MYIGYPQRIPTYHKFSNSLHTLPQQIPSNLPFYPSTPTMNHPNRNAVFEFQSQPYSSSQCIPILNKSQMTNSIIQNQRGSYSNNSHNSKKSQLKQIQNFSYLTNEEIGVGFNSKVYKGKNDLNNEEVAIKVINLESMQDELNRKFLNQEISVLETILKDNHINLLKLQGVFKTKNNIYIITEYCQGKDLGKLIRKKKIFNEVEAQSIIKQIINGFIKLCQLGIVHRDFKLGNLFIKNGNIKIADFGFATSIENCQKQFSYNVGSPHYMPPETLKHNKYSHKSDIWAIGIIAYQLVHGKAPWKDKNDAILYQKIITIPIQSLINPQLQLSDNYINFIKGCLTLDFKRRFGPQDVNNWEWNKALSYVQGGEQKSTKFIPPFLMHSLHKKLSYPGNEITQQNFNKGPQKSFASIINQHHQQIVSSGSLESLFRNNNKDTYPIYSTKKEQGKLTSRDKQNSPYLAQQALLAEINYCRFMSQLFEEIQKVTNYNRLNYNRGRSQTYTARHKQNLSFYDSIDQIKQSIKEKVCNKINILMEMCQTSSNILLIDGFDPLIKQPAWQKLKNIIFQHNHKFDQQFNFKSQIFISKNINIEQCLLFTIRTLQSQLGKNSTYLRLLELLLFYNDALSLQKSGNPSILAKVSKIDLLGGTKINQNIVRQRVFKKMQQLGL